MVFRWDVKTEWSQAFGQRRRAFTLAQLVVVMAVVAILTCTTFAVVGRSRRAALRVTCNMHLTAISLALDAYRQEYRAYPASLAQLQKAKFLQDPSVLHCPRDPRPTGTYDDFYLFRSARPVTGDTRDPNTLPFVVCPFHEEDNGVGIQAFPRETQQNAVYVATLSGVTSATVERPGKTVIAARGGMQVRGGDRIRTAAGGGATIQFADGSTAQLLSNADATVLQSFISGHSHAPLYTLLRQNLGEIAYKVHHGSRFDVATPTATAGALGTEFRIKRSGNSWYLKVTDSKVMCSSQVGNFVQLPIDLSLVTNLLGRQSSSDWTYIGQSSQSPYGSRN